MDGIYIALICLGAAAAVVLIALFCALSNNLLQVSRYEVESPKLEKNLRIVHLSDLHAKRFGRGNGVLLNAIEARKPDIIAVTGDIIHKYRDKDLRTAAETVKKLSEIAPVYYVSGNHEMRSKKYRSLRDRLRVNGAKVLDDEAEETCGITLAGVNCAHIKCGKFFNMAGDTPKFTVLLAHFPQYIDKYALAGYDLALCGHAHGGQWRIPFTDVGFYSPGQGLFPKYTSGVHSCGNMLEIISRGLGNSQCPLRLFNRPEIVVVDLIKKE